MAHANSADYAARLHLRPGDVVYDIGANAGYVTGVLADIAGHVFAFEPNPDIVQPLRERALPNVTIVGAAISDRCGRATLHIDVREDESAVGSSLMLLQGMAGKTRPIEVDTITVDAFASQTGTVPDLIKIDVEGLEAEVIAGAAGIIAARRPIIIFELWETHWARLQPTIRALSRDYYLVRLSTGGGAVAHYDATPGDAVDDILCIPLRVASGTS